MKSLILRIAGRNLLPLFVFFSFIILIRGHDAPGGGFVGGLLAAAGFILYAVAYDVKSAQSKLHIEPIYLIGSGLLLALLSGAITIFTGTPFKTIEFFVIYIPSLLKIGVSTPLFFDIGVYLVVVGVLLNVVFPLMEE